MFASLTFKCPPSHPSNLANLLISHNKLPSLALTICRRPEPVNVREVPASALKLAAGLRMEGPTQPTERRCFTVSHNFLYTLKDELCPKSRGDIVTHLGFDQCRCFGLSLYILALAHNVWNNDLYT